MYLALFYLENFARPMTRAAEAGCEAGRVKTGKHTQEKVDHTPWQIPPAFLFTQDLVSALKEVRVLDMIICNKMT